MKTFITDYFWQLEMILKGRKDDVTFERLNPIKKLIEETVSKVREIRENELYKESVKEGLIRDIVIEAQNQCKLLTQATKNEYSNVHQAIRSKMYSNPQTEMQQLLTFMKQEAIRSRIGNDLLKFIADNPSAMDDLDILGAVMSDPAKVLSAQAKKMHDGEASGIDIEKMHLMEKHPELYNQLETSEANGRTAASIFSATASALQLLVSDNPGIDPGIQLSEVH